MKKQKIIASEDELQQIKDLRDRVGKEKFLFALKAVGVNDKTTSIATMKRLTQKQARTILRLMSNNQLTHARINNTHFGESAKRDNLDLALERFISHLHKNKETL